MQFDLRSVEPPMLELAALLGWLVIGSSVAGAVWAMVTRLRGQAGVDDRLAWARASGAGVVVGLSLLWAVSLEWEPDYYIVLLTLWLVVAGEGAALLLWALRGNATKLVGRRTFQALGVGCVSAIGSVVLCNVLRATLQN